MRHSGAGHAIHDQSANEWRTVTGCAERFTARNTTATSTSGVRRLVRNEWIRPANRLVDRSQAVADMVISAVALDAPPKSHTPGWKLR